MFIGVLAGSIFSSSGAFADVVALSSISDQVTDGNVTLVSGTTYVAGSPTDTFTFGGGSTYFGNFLGTFSGNGATITGLTVPLFDGIGGRVSDLVLVTDANGVAGSGALANSTFMYTIVEDVRVSGAVIGDTDYVGGVVGSVGYGGTISTSTFTGTVTGESHVGGLAGSSGGTIASSSASGIVNSAVSRLVESLTDDINVYYESAISGSHIGGLVGSSSGTIISSSADVDVSSTATISTGNALTDISVLFSHAASGSHIGGLVGSSTGTITSSSASGDVSSTATISLGSATGGDISIRFSSVTAGSHIGGLVGSSTGTITSSSAIGDVTSRAAISVGDALTSIYSQEASVTAGSKLGGLVGSSAADILNSYAGASGDVSSTTTTSLGTASDTTNWVPLVSPGGDVGGLVGYAEENVSNSYASGSVTGNVNVGGLVGHSLGTIENTYSTGSVNGGTYTGGLVGRLEGEIRNSYSISSVNQGIDGANRIGGLVGAQLSGSISNSYATGGGFGIIGSPDFVGGLVGWLDTGEIENSFAFVNGDVGGDFSFYSIHSTDGLTPLSYGGLIGNNPGGGAVSGSYGYVSGNSYPNSNIIFNGAMFSISSDSSCAYQANSEGNFVRVYGLSESCLLGPSNLQNFPSVLTVVNAPRDGESAAGFGQNSCFNSGNPYLLELSDEYESCDSGSIDLPRRVRVEREIREVAEVRNIEKIERAIGFKNESPLPKNAAIAFVDSTEKIDLAKVKAVEISAAANVRVDTRAGEALQISLNSESKAPVELWVLSPDGKWLLAGVITFDKDGKAILPPLQFKNAGDYSLVFSTPSADSTNASAPLNLSGQVLISVI